MMRKPAKPEVLRGVALHPQPHTLNRPTRPLRPASAVDVSKSMPAKRIEPQDSNEGAQRQSAALLEQAYEQAKQKGLADGRKAGFEEGRVEGFEKGRAEGLQAGQAAAYEAAASAFRERLDRLDKLLRDLPAQIDRRLIATEDDMVDTVFAAVCRIAGESATSEDGIRSIVRTAVAQLRTRPITAIRVHPNDLAGLQSDSEFEALVQRHHAETHLQWIPDERVKLGGCIVESPEGSLDARLEIQLQGLRELLLQVRSARAATGVAS
jgi:flagellar assembly protein FliH